MINWNSCAPLTKAEWLDFLALGVPYLKDMESKNDWDFFINDFSFGMICNMFLCHAYSIDSPEDWQNNFTKAQDLEATCKIIDEIDWSQEEKNRNDKTNQLMIYDLILKKVYKVTNKIFEH